MKMPLSQSGIFFIECLYFIFTFSYLQIFTLPSPSKTFQL
jgi:hypothetical protein